MVPWVALPVGAVCAGHGCGGQPAVSAYHVAALASLELVGFPCWQGFATLELAAAPLGVVVHPTCPFHHFWGAVSSLGVVSTAQLVSVSFRD